jgi:hypothetical protein
MTPTYPSDAPDEFDFVVTDYIQRLEGWTTVSRVVDANARAAFAMAELYASAVFVPICGQAIQKRGTFGVDPDGFMMQKASFRFEARADVRRATIVGWLPEGHGKDVEVAVSCGDRSACNRFAANSMFVLSLDVEVGAGSEHELLIELSSSFQPSSQPGGSTDYRRLGCILQSIEFS